jgi:hypothetical protein
MLIVLVEVDREQALYVAETIRQRLDVEPLRVGEGKRSALPPASASPLTTATGLRNDTERCRRRAYEAKRGNRCVVSDADCLKLLLNHEGHEEHEETMASQ